MVLFSTRPDEGKSLALVLAQVLTLSNGGQAWGRSNDHSRYVAAFLGQGDGYVRSDR